MTMMFARPCCSWLERGLMLPLNLMACSPTRIEFLIMTNRNREFHQNSAHMLIGALRQTYGPSFAKGFADNERLSDVLAKDTSLRRVIRDREAGRLEQISRGWKA
jgi:hypothetical protein